MVCQNLIFRAAFSHALCQVTDATAQRIFIVVKVLFLRIKYPIVYNTFVLVNVDFMLRQRYAQMQRTGIIDGFAEGEKSEPAHVFVHSNACVALVN